MKKEAAGVIRHPHYPEIIKFKLGSVKTISTLSASNWDEEFNNSEKLSQIGDCFQIGAENFSCLGDNESAIPHYSSSKNHAHPDQTFDKSDFELEDQQTMYEDECFVG